MAKIVQSLTQPTEKYDQMVQQTPIMDIPADVEGLINTR